MTKEKEKAVGTKKRFYKLDYNKRSDKFVITTGWAITIMFLIIALLSLFIITYRGYRENVELVRNYDNLILNMSLQYQIDINKREEAIAAKEFKIDSLQLEVEICAGALYDPVKNECAEPTEKNK